jgi:hypothetical protein
MILEGTVRYFDNSNFDNAISYLIDNSYIDKEGYFLDGNSNRVLEADLNVDHEIKTISIPIGFYRDLNLDSLFLNGNFYFLVNFVGEKNMLAVLNENGVIEEYNLYEWATANGIEIPSEVTEEWCLFVREAFLDKN